MKTLSICAQVVGGDPQFVEPDGAVGQEPTEQGVGHRPGLLVDLLAHEVGVAALLGRLHVPVDLQLGRLDHLAGQRRHPHRTGPQLHHLVVVEDPEAPGVPEQGRDVRGQQGRRGLSPSPIPTTRGETRRAATIVPGSDAAMTARAKAPRTSRSDDADGVGQRRPRRHLLLDQMGEHLGVGVGREQVAAVAEPGRQLAPVLDDPVVDDGHPAAAVEVGVGVLLGRVTVGGPAGVADPGRHPGGGVLDDLAEVLERAGPRGRAGPVEVAAVVEGDAGRVVSPVLEPLQAVEQEIEDAVVTRGSDDAAHGPRLRRARDRGGAFHDGAPAAPPTGVGEILVGRLDHDPDEGLGPAGPQQDPAAVAELAGHRRHLGLDVGALHHRAGSTAGTLTRTWGSRRMTSAGQLGQRPARSAAAGPAGARR